MTSGSSETRVVQCIAVAVLISAVYLGYSAALAPLLDVERKERPQSALAENENVTSGAEDLARRWFREAPWVAHSGNHFRDGERYLYYGASALADDGMSLEAKPVALLWIGEDTEPDDMPVTVLADKATLRTSEPLSLQGDGIGRIVSGSLDGRVQVRGPQNLRIEGSQFSISEDSLTLSSGRPVTFEWEDHSGTAASGVDIELRTPQTVEEGGLLSVADVSEIRLNGKVTCRMLFRARRADEEDIRLHVTAADGFKYDVDTRTGKFVGLRKRSRNRPLPGENIDIEDQVLVRRELADGTRDRLFCSELRLGFRPEVSPETGQVVSNRLKLEHIAAVGEHVVFYSESRQLKAKMTELAYLVDERRISMRNTTLKDGRPVFVELEQGGSSLLVSELQVLHAPDGRVQRLECRGPGIVRHQEAIDSDVMSARWRSRLVIQETADQAQQIVTMMGDAGVEQAQQGFGLSAQQIVMTLRNAESDNPAGHKSAGHVVSSPAPDPVNLQSLSPDQLTASGGVSLTSPDATGTIRDRLTVRFEASATTQPDDNETDSPLLANRQQGAEASSTPEVAFEADTLQATIRSNGDGEQRRMQLANVWLTGQVQLTRADAQPDRAFVARGNSLEAVNGLHNTREIRLFGDPASIVTGLRRLEGKRIDLDEEPGRLTVNGSGRMRMVTDKGFDGKQLPRPTPLDIYWSDEMTFQGRVAHFVGNIRVAMKDGVTQDLELTCAGLKVFFNQAIGLDRPHSSAREPIEISRIECVSTVRVTIDELRDQIVRARYRLRVVNLTVNADSGQFSANGPGWLASTTPDAEGPLQATPAASARANRPASIKDSAFVFAKAEFIGELTGNMKQQNATLSQRVRAVFAPVRSIDEEFSVKTIPTDELPEHVHILRADRLSVAAIPTAIGQTPSFSLTATDNAGIESMLFSGNADVVTYDHSKQQFILRAEGSRTAAVRYRKGRESGYQVAHGQRFQYHRATRSLESDSVSGLNVTQ